MNRASRQRVFLDLRPTVNAHSKRGIGRYVSGFFADLLEHPNYGSVSEARGWVPRRTVSLPEGVTGWLPPRPAISGDPLAAWSVRRHLERRDDITLVHLTDPYLVQWGPRAVPWIVTVYDLIGLTDQGRLGSRFRAGLELALSRPGTWFTTISETVASELRAIGVDEQRLSVLPPGLTPLPVSAVGSGFAGALVVGALDAHKQPSHAMEAAQLAGVDVLFAGRHEAFHLETLGLESHQFLSDPTDSELGRLVKDALCTVHASAVEGFGLPVLESLSAGTPVAAYDLPVTREIVGPDFPLVPESEGPEGLGRMIMHFRDPAARAQAVRQAQPYLARFDWASTWARRDDMYARLLGLD